MGIVFGLNSLIVECSSGPKNFVLSTIIQIFLWNYGFCDKVILTKMSTNFMAKISVFFDFLKVVLELLTRCLGNIFGLKRHTIEGRWSSKSKFRVKYQPSDRAILWQYLGPQISFFEWLRVIGELFRSSLGIIFGPLGPTFRCILSSKGWYMAPKIKI